MCVGSIDLSLLDVELGPAIAAGVESLDCAIGIFTINADTFPGLVTAGCYLLLMVALIWKRRREENVYQQVGTEGEIPNVLSRSDSETSTPVMRDNDYNEADNDVAWVGYLNRSLGVKLTHKEAKAVLLCGLCVFAISLCFTVFETVLTPLVEAAYQWGVSETGLLFTGLGIVSLAVQMILFVFPSEPCLSYLLASLFVQGLSLLGLISYSSSTYLSLAQCLIACFFLVVSYSWSLSLAFSLSLALTKRHKQGGLMGLLTSVASLARLLGPLIFASVIEISLCLWVFLPMALFVLVVVWLPFATVFRPIMQSTSLA